MMNQLNMGAIRRISNMTIQDIAKYTNIPEKRLEAIETETEKPTMAELRDIAMILGTNVRGLCGTSYFGIQLNAPHMCVTIGNKKENLYINGYWGHIGILPEGQKEYLWFPIQNNVPGIFYRPNDDAGCVCIPTSNNKLLMLNMRYIAEVILLDDDCDAPAFVNWNAEVNNTITSPVVYEALEDYEYDCTDSDTMSPAFEEAMQKFTEELEEDAENFMHTTSIFYKNGLIRNVNASETPDGLYREIFEILNFPGIKLVSISFEDTQGADITINMNHVAMMVMPLAQAEAVFDEIEDQFSDELDDEDDE